MRRITLHGLPVTMLLGVVVLAGCTSAAEQAIERSAPGTDVEIDRDGGVVIEDDEGSLRVETGGELPQPVADAFAVPDDHVVDFTSSVTDGGLIFVSVGGHLERDDIGALNEELTSAITGAGWTIVTSFSSGEDARLIGAKRGDQQLQVSIAPGTEPSRFDVVINVSAEGE